MTDDHLLDSMVKDPILINRPFVVTPPGTRLSRPSELVLDILPDTHNGALTKGDGERVHGIWSRTPACRGGGLRLDSSRDRRDINVIDEKISDDLMKCRTRLNKLRDYKAGWLAGRQR